mmetsp:Transcript_8297/g.11124  ORF Transcript_8297/g.11124 Transcript_8297/m.11124 type:complete len:99 (-) Transcript_8297:825-1121(-)
MSVYNRVHDTGVPNAKAGEPVEEDDDEWETDPEPANLVTPMEQRWGAKHLPQDRKEFKDMKDLREQVIQQHKEVEKKEYEAQGRAGEYQKPGTGQSTD